MNRMVPFFVMMLCCNCLFSTVVRSSNSIGQDRGLYDGQSEYVLKSEGDRSQLFFKDELQWTCNTTPTKKGYMKDMSFTDNSLPVKRWYENTQLLKETEGAQTRYYSYDEKGRLIKNTVLEDGQVSLLQFYTYDASSKSLNGILSITLDGSKIAYYGQDWFSYTESDYFEKITTFADNITVKEAWKGQQQLVSAEVIECNEEGFVLQRVLNGITVKEKYDHQGLLIREIAPSFQVEYQYNENRDLLKEIRQTTDGMLYSTMYAEGRRVLQTIRNKTNLEKEIKFDIDGTRVETLFDEGLPYCDITYAADGKRVLSIVYR